jgi:glycosyltransferase involved in cell wall biosynthesis
LRKSCAVASAVLSRFRVSVPKAFAPRTAHPTAPTFIPACGSADDKGRARPPGAPNESPTMVANSLMESDPLAQIRLQTAAVIPAYQDEKHIGDIVRRTRERLDHVLVVDDGSSDQTAQRAREAGAEVVVHNQNRGKGEAIKTGLGHWLAAASPSGGELNREITWVSLLDSDGQHLPEEIDRFIAAAARATRSTFFVGNRMNNLAGMPFIRRVVNRYMSMRISRLCGQRIPDTQCGFRMLNRQLIPELLGGGDRFDYETEVLIIASRKGYRIESVPITTVYTDQVSKIHPVRDALRFFKLMWRYRKLPHATGGRSGY